MSSGVGKSFALLALLVVLSGCTLGTLQPGNGRVPLAATANACADPLPMWIAIQPLDSNPFDYESVVGTMAALEGVFGINGSDYRCVYIERAKHVNGDDEIELTFYHYSAEGQISSPLSLVFYGTPTEGTTYPIDLSGGLGNPLTGAASLSGTAPLFERNLASVATNGFLRFNHYPAAGGGPMELVFQATLVSVGYNAGETPPVHSVSSKVKVDY